mmetsp:Transcript_229/g.684  ORF Transcript_229/g.684 Transcript_229/m.684 type:complete len:211 (+) Transcript_229:2437-3069(+)
MTVATMSTLSTRASHQAAQVRRPRESRVCTMAEQACAIISASSQRTAHVRVARAVWRAMRALRARLLSRWPATPSYHASKAPAERESFRRAPRSVSVMGAILRHEWRQRLKAASRWWERARTRSVRRRAEVTARMRHRWSALKLTRWKKVAPARRITARFVSIRLHDLTALDLVPSSGESARMASAARLRCVRRESAHPFHERSAVEAAL